MGRGALRYEIVHSSLSCERGCPKHGRNALPRAGFTLEKCLIFPGDASPAPISHAVAAEIPRNDESAGKRHFVLALHQETAVPLVSGSKVRYSTAAGDDCYSLFSGAIQPGSQMENACRASCHKCAHLSGLGAPSTTAIATIAIANDSRRPNPSMHETKTDMLTKMAFQKDPVR